MTKQCMCRQFFVMAVIVCGCWDSDGPFQVDEILVSNPSDTNSDKHTDSETLEEASIDTDEVDPCADVHCDEKPVSVCIGKDLFVYKDEGWCDDGTCHYPGRYVETCEHKCEDGACVNPCADLQCDISPKAVCIDDQTLMVTITPGKCEMIDDEAECYYASSQIICEMGCEAGRCI